MWPFGRARRERRDDERERRQDVIQLTETLLVKRLEAEAHLEAAKAEAQLKAMERELALQERQLEHHRKMSDERRERARQQRELRGADARRFGPVRRPTQPGTCRACVAPGDPTLTAAEIIEHKAHFAS